MKLRALEPEDLELLYTIENDMAMWNVGNTNVPYSRYDLRDYILNQQHDIYKDGQVRFVVEDSARAVGLVDLFNFSPRDLRAEVGIAILKEQQGEGLGQEALRQLSEYAFGTLGLHQLYAFVSEKNEVAKKCFEKAGYKQTAVLKDWIRKVDVFENAVIYTLLK